MAAGCLTLVVLVALAQPHVDNTTDASPEEAPWEAPAETPTDEGAPADEVVVTPAPTAALCTADERVSSKACVPCGRGTVSAPGGNPAGPDTNCTAARSFVFGLKITNETAPSSPEIFDPSGPQTALMTYLTSRDPLVRNLTFTQLCTYAPGVESNAATYPGGANQCQFVRGNTQAVECSGVWCDYVLWASVVTTDRFKLIHILTDPKVDWAAMGIYGSVRFVDIVPVATGETKVMQVSIGRHQSAKTVFRRMAALTAGVRNDQVAIYGFGGTVRFVVVGVDTYLATAIEESLSSHFNNQSSWITNFFQASAFRLTTVAALTSRKTEKSTPQWATILLIIAASLICIGAVGAVLSTAEPPSSPVGFTPCVYTGDDKIEAAEKRIRETKYRTTLV